MGDQTRTLSAVTTVPRLCRADSTNCIVPADSFAMHTLLMCSNRSFSLLSYQSQRAVGGRAAKEASGTHALGSASSARVFSMKPRLTSAFCGVATRRRCRATGALKRVE